MVLGTGSHVGKSLLTTALCRLFSDRGLDVAPFKAQNMSLEAAVTPEGHEIGRAQALQAEAARRAPHADMNPILIKPTGDRHAQVIVEGRIWGDTDAWDYHRRRTHELFPRVLACYERLAARCDLVVLEGAGSPAEINLRDGDIVNMRMAAAASAPCVLVVDIERGGAFAALFGTLALLEPDERARVCGFIINKFRGDVGLLESGIRDIEQRTGSRCFGVVPWFDDLGLEEEDGYGAFGTSHWIDEAGTGRRLRVAVVRAPYASNLSDFIGLTREPGVSVRDVRDADDLGAADVVVLPGSKSTVADLGWMRSRSFEGALERHVDGGGIVFGICGGMQMLGERLDDPSGVEGGGAARGFGMLPVTTTLAREKSLRRVSGVPTGAAFGDTPAVRCTFRGYEIHAGVSDVRGRAFARLRDDADGMISDDGAVSGNGRVAGSYVHGLLDDDAFRHATIAAWRRLRGLAPAAAWSHFGREREARIDRWAAHVAGAVDVDALAAIAGITGARA
jgi:adenosylcobyric acid synthase